MICMIAASLFEVLLSMIVLQVTQVLCQSSGGIVSRAAAKGTVGGRTLGFPLFTMQGGPGGHLRFPLGINRVDRCRFPVPRFLEILNRCILHIFYVLVEKKFKKKILDRLLAVVVQKCTSRL
jgi:hypothetical protein